MIDTIIYLLFILPLLSVFIILFLDKNNIKLIKNVSAILAILILVVCLFLQFLLNFNSDFFSYYNTICLSSYLNIYYSIGIDSLAYYLILLSTLLTVLCILVIWEIKYKLKEFIMILFTIEFLLINVFSAVDLIFFYIFFEAILIPMFLMIGIWGARNRRIDAAYQFFIYTFLGSVFMLIAILYIYITAGTTHLFTLLTFTYSKQIQIFLWLAFFVSFAVKVPMFPIHLWLPEAHTEAPTAGSVLLAGILLKLGTYGMIRFMIPVFPDATVYFTPAVYTLSIIGIIYTSLTALRQIDLKKAIAYSSVAHMSLVTIGIFTNTLSGVKGSTFLMISHGVVSSALFILIGIIYDRYKTRNVRYYGGLALIMPLFATFFLIHILSNMGFPGTSGFIGEFLILLLAYNSNTLVAILATTGVIFSAAYSIWLYNRICFGNIKYTYIQSHAEVNEREFSVILILSIYTIILGIYPNIILNAIDHSILKILI